MQQRCVGEAEGSRAASAGERRVMGGKGKASMDRDERGNEGRIKATV